MKQQPDSVYIERRARIGVIIVDHPPVNSLTPSVRRGILRAALELQADGSIDAIVLHCAGSTFIAGADLRAMNGPPPDPSTADVVAALESSVKPVIAALHGHTLGGGLEFALGCHYRCAVSGTKLGAPEIRLGLIPGAGGTQRLPRLIGFTAALEMILSGTPIDAARALSFGLIDQLFAAGAVLDQACDFAGRVVAAARGIRRTRDLPALWQSADDEAFNRAIDNRLKHGTELARVSAIEAVRAASEVDFEAGMSREKELFASCRDSTESRALRHLFLAERAAAHVLGFSSGGPARRVQSVAVIGAGTMGRGIALAFAAANFDVALLEADRSALDRALASIDEQLLHSVSKGRLTADARAQRLARIHGTVDDHILGQVDLAVEAVFEDMAVKQDLFRKLDKLCPARAILATNTSALDIDAIAAVTVRPSSVVGLHFFSPANVMRLVEIVRGRVTSAAVLQAAMDVVKQLGKLGVIAGNCDGFIGNRMLTGYRREAEYLLLEGATPAQVDGALTRFGMAMGPLAMSDLAGLDIGAAGRARRRLAGTAPIDPRFGVISDRLVARGSFGQKTGSGFFRYEPGTRASFEDSTVQDVIVAEAARLGIGRREITDREIVERCILPLINEGARVVSEGIAQRPGDVDLVWVNGYGFPKLRGGPMQYADSIGLPTVLESLGNLAASQGPELWTPAPLLQMLVSRHQTFDDLNHESVAV